MSKVVQVANMMANNPETTAADVANKFKVTKPYAYALMSNARKEFLNRRDEQAAKPKTRMQSASAPTETQMLNLDDMVNHPLHYKTGGIETIDFIEAKGLNYHLGNVVKYITRADLKGDRLENLRKARWYLDREVERASKAK
jgi:hypothetical protein